MQFNYSMVLQRVIHERLNVKLRSVLRLDLVGCIKLFLICIFLLFLLIFHFFVLF